MRLEPYVYAFKECYLAIDDGIDPVNKPTGQVVAIIFNGPGGIVIYRHYSVDPEMILDLLPDRLASRYKVYDCKIMEELQEVPG